MENRYDTRLLRYLVHVLYVRMQTYYNVDITICILHTNCKLCKISWPSTVIQEITNYVVLLVRTLITMNKEICVLFVGFSY